MQRAYRTDPTHEGGEFVKRRAVGNAIEAVGILKIHASRVWILAALSDVCGVGRALIPEIADALKSQGLLDPGTEFATTDERLEGLMRASARLAGNFNMPPLDVASLKKELAALREDARSCGQRMQTPPTSWAPCASMSRRWAVGTWRRPWQKRWRPASTADRDHAVR